MGQGSLLPLEEKGWVSCLEEVGWKTCAREHSLETSLFLFHLLENLDPLQRSVSEEAVG